MARRVLTSGEIEQVPATALRKEDVVRVNKGELIPTDGEVIEGVALVDESAITTSASGLDPDISPANAALQVARVARARGVSPADISALLDRRIIDRSLRVFGEPRVNVLDLNLALQRAYPKPD